MAFGWDDAIMALLAGISLFGGKKNQEQTTTASTTSPPWQPRDPGYNLLSPYLLSMLTQNMGRLSGAGYPGGIGIGGDMTQQLIDMIGQSWPDILNNAGGATKSAPTTKERAQTCTEKCANVTGSSSAEREMNRVACLKKCMAASEPATQ